MLSAFVEDREYLVPELKSFQIGRTYSLIVEDIIISPNKVQGSTGLKGSGLIYKCYDNLSSDEKKLVDTAEPGPKYRPRYGDTISVSFRGTGPQENQTVNFDDGLEFVINNGEIPGFVVGLVRRLFGVELEPHTTFRITDYFKQGMKFKAKMIEPRTQGGRVAIDTKTLELDDGSVSSTVPQENKSLSKEAQLLKELITASGLTTKFDIMGRLKDWSKEEEIDLETMKNAWNEIKENYK